MHDHELIERLSHSLDQLTEHAELIAQRLTPATRSRHHRPARRAAWSALVAGVVGVGAILVAHGRSESRSVSSGARSRPADSSVIDVSSTAPTAATAQSTTMPGAPAESSPPLVGTGAPDLAYATDADTAVFHLAFSGGFRDDEPFAPAVVVTGDGHVIRSNVDAPTGPHGMTQSASIAAIPPSEITNLLQLASQSGLLDGHAPDYSTATRLPRDDYTLTLTIRTVVGTFVHTAYGIDTMFTYPGITSGREPTPESTPARRALQALAVALLKLPDQPLADHGVPYEPARYRVHASPLQPDGDDAGVWPDTNLPRLADASTCTIITAEQYAGVAVANPTYDPESLPRRFRDTYGHLYEVTATPELPGNPPC